MSTPFKENQSRTRPLSASKPGHEDELLKKFTKNMRRVIENRENVTHGTRGVRFNPEVVETSICGTQTPGRIKGCDSILESTQSSEASTDNDDSSYGTVKNVHQRINELNKAASNMSQNGSATKKPRQSVDSTKNSRTATAGDSVDKKLNSNPSVHTPGKDRSACTATPVFNVPTPRRSPMHPPAAVTPTMPRRHTLEQMQVNTPECFNPVSFETPGSVKRHRNSSDMVLEANEDSCSVTVAVRVRPFSQREMDLQETKCVVSMVHNQTIVTGENGAPHHFAYDHSFWSFDHKQGDFADQEYVYNMLGQPMLSRAFEGYNTCLFAYGQTGSGKSYSIMGHGNEVGIIPRFCEELFARAEYPGQEMNINVEISFFEIYNEKIHDLLAPSNKDKTGKKANLKVREHPVLGPYVEGLSCYVVKSFEDVKGWLNLGNKQRATASTGMNDKSSRSHSVFTLVLTQTKMEECEGLEDTIEGEAHEHTITSKINLVDLAGSERQSHAKTSGDRLKQIQSEIRRWEGVSINKSLLTLGKVISQLSEQSISTKKKKKFFIPYRDSVLTWLLKESLGGNSKTTMLATISPSLTHIEETLSTLRYAKQARTIINSAKVNEDPKARLIRELRAEIEKLKGQQNGPVNEDVIQASIMEIACLKEQLAKKEHEMQEVTRSWQEKLKKSELRKQEEAQLMEKSGMSFTVDNTLPSLVNLNEDPQLSEMLLYIIREGQTKVGRMQDKSTLDIQLSGALIADNHCQINYVNGKTTIAPVADAVTYVNGDLITGPTLLHHGDRVILGGNHYFRFSNPREAAELRKHGSFGQTAGGQPKDFAFARDELSRVQNARLQQELEAAQKAHEKEMQRLQDEKERQQMALRQQMEQTREAMDHEMSLQRHEYEDRLAELEKQLQAQKEVSHQSDQQAQDEIKRLEQQKMRLESEVLANRKRLELEAREANKAVHDESRREHLCILEMLEKARQQATQEVERLMAAKQKRTEKIMTADPKGTSGSFTDLYRVTLMMREANKISQLLGKDTLFAREDVCSNGKVETLVKVTKSKLGVSTFWTLEKFEERLRRMRDLYQGDDDSTAAECEEVFFDPNDAWEKDDRIDCSPSISPRMLKSIQKVKKSEDPVLRLSFDSTSSMESKKRGHSRNTVSSASSVGSNRPDKPLPVISTCRDMLATTIERFTDAALQQSLADRVLSNCESIKNSISTLLEAYGMWSDQNKDWGKFVESPVVRVQAIHLTNEMHQLLSHCALWTASYQDLGSGLVRELAAKINNTTKQLGNHLMLFMQGCENDIESIVQDLAGKSLDCLYQLCRHCGELAIATEAGLTLLKDAAGEGTHGDAHLQLGHDIRQAFLNGCDHFIDRTIQGGIRSVEDSEAKLQLLHDACTQQKDTKFPKDKLLSYVVMTAASVRVLLERCQQVQVEVDSTMTESVDPKPESYYVVNFSRSQGLAGNVTALADGVTLLTQVAAPVAEGKKDSLRKLSRCAEMVQKAASKLLVSSEGIQSPASSTSDGSEISVLSDSQVDMLEWAVQEVKSSTGSLITLSLQHANPSDPSSPTKVKRILPLSPDDSPTKLGLKPHNQRSRNSLKRNLAYADMVPSD